MVPGAHRGSAYSEGAEAGEPADGRGWLIRLWHRLRPPLSEPYTGSISLPETGGIRRSTLAHLQAEDVRRVRFTTTHFRAGYNQEQVDEFLARVERQLRSGRPRGGVPPLTPEAVIDQRFSATKFRVGYDQDEVDDFLDRIVTELRRTQ